MLLFLPWLLRGHERPEYAAFRQLHAHDEDGLVWEASTTAQLLAGLVVARLTFNALLRGPTARLAAARGDTPHHRDGSKLLEELWVLAGNSLMLGAAMFVVLRRNGGCWFGDTRTCLRGWPALPADPAVNLYYHAELAWYLHMLLKPVLRYGLPDGRDMLIHHFATLALILTSYGTNLTRVGVLVLAVFALSNPLLHAAKICNQLSLGALKVGGFVAFAAAFFASRVLLVPWAVLKPCVVDSRKDIPHVVEDFAGIYHVICGLLLLLYALQLLWMRGIVRVLSSAVRHGADAASALSARVDPAKRYAVPAEPQPAESTSGSDSDRARVNGGAGEVAQGALRGAEANGTAGAAGAAAKVPKTPSPADPGALLGLVGGPREVVGENDKDK